ncbi:MAG: hypothetical protein K2I17_06230 [Clostridia bacterium]|nr:hypothetical protein [Clostridia bacterium]MDE6790197.1 hypothetical protein [Clostridia bacterium]
MENRESVRDALKKCAVGLSASEVVEEFAVEDGELKLIKKKVTRRDIPPDIKAVKLLLDSDDLSAATDGELEEERNKLLKMLKEGDCD